MNSRNKLPTVPYVETDTMESIYDSFFNVPKDAY